MTDAVLIAGLAATSSAMFFGAPSGNNVRAIEDAFTAKAQASEVRVATSNPSFADVGTGIVVVLNQAELSDPRVNVNTVPSAAFFASWADEWGDDEDYA